MKLQQKFAYLSVLLASFGISACDDDSSDSCGITEESCQSLNKTLNADKCICVENNENPNGSLCPTGKHVFGNTCEDDSLQNCGQHGYDCTSMIQGWSAGGCLNSACEATACTTGFHTFNHICEADTLQNCGTHDNTCSIAVAGWKSGTCSEGQCVAAECSDGYHLYLGSCELNDISACGSHENDCAITQIGWKTGVCNKGTCQALSCIENMHVEDGVCKADDAEHCGATQANCTQTGECKSPAIGDIISFGHYEQDNDTTNGKETITWRVLDKNAAGQYLVISEKALDVQPYNTAFDSITWEKSTIRSWLNGYDASTNTVGKNFSSDNFIDTAFTADEKAKIVSSSVPADKNPKYSTDPGSSTTDKIFLLSIIEAQTYLTNYAYLQADTTRYVVKKGALVLGSSSNRDTRDGSCTDDHCYSHWWLRSPGDSGDCAAFVFLSGNIKDVGVDVNLGVIAVRPALWVNL